MKIGRTDQKGKSVIEARTYIHSYYSEILNIMLSKKDADL